MPDQRFAHFTRLAALGLLLLTVVAYAPAILAGGFIWDDDSYLTANTLITQPGGLAAIWTPGETAQYYPLVFTSFLLEYQLWGLDPVGYHAVNVLLHAAVSILLLGLLRRLRIPAALLIAAAFALHPMHVESVAWITERKNVLSGVLYLLAAHAWLRFDPMEPENDAAPPHRMWWYAASIVAFAGALLSKSVTASLPAALILLMVLRRVPLSPRRLLPLVPLFVLGALAALHTAGLEQTLVGATGSAFDLSPADRIVIAGRALVFYPLKLIAPAPLLFIYPRWTIEPWMWLFPAIVVAAFAITVVLFRRGRRGPFVALAFYAGTVLPAVGLVNVYPHRFSFVADHFVYLASIGILALVIGGAAHGLGAARRRLGVVLAAGIGCVFFGLTWHQSALYTSAETIWRATVAGNDSAWLAHGNLASLLARRAAAESTDQSNQLWDEAFDHAHRAYELMPDDAPILGTLAELERRAGHFERTVLLQERALAIVEREHPDSLGLVPHLLSLGRAYYALGSAADAVTAYERAVARTPPPDPILAELASAYLAAGDFAGALRIERDLSSRRPASAANSLRIAQIARRAQRDGICRDALHEVLRLARGDQLRTYQAQSLLARLLAESTDPAIRDERRAVEVAEAMCATSLRRIPGLLDVLASVYFATGDAHRALVAADEALVLAREQGLDDLAAAIAARAETYRQAAADSPGVSPSDEVDRLPQR